MAVASLLIASLASGWAVTAADFGGAAIADRETNTGCSTTAFIVAADGSMRGQKAKTRTPANAPATRPAKTFHRIGSASPPLLHQAAPTREAVIEPVRILGAQPSACVSRRFRRRPESVERRVGRSLPCVEPLLRRGE